MQQNTQSPERPRGRPANDNQRDLKTQILNNAEQFFADDGYPATSIRRIADEAGVNPALIHYYFGNKRALLLKVMERSFEPLKNTLAAMNDGHDASPGMIAKLLLSMAADHPNVPRLMTREVLLPGGEMQEFFIENMAPMLGGVLPGLLAREKAASRLKDDADPAISALLILAVSVFPFIARELAGPVLGVDFDDDGIEMLTQQVANLLTRGMT